MKKQNGRTSKWVNQRLNFIAHSPILPLIFSLFVIGCAENKSTTRPSDWSQQAENDPTNFDPKLDDSNISGGSIDHFDKNAFNKDMDDVLNP